MEPEVPAATHVTFRVVPAQPSWSPLTTVSDGGSGKSHSLIALISETIRRSFDDDVVGSDDENHRRKFSWMVIFPDTFKHVFFGLGVAHLDNFPFMIFIIIVTIIL